MADNARGIHVSPGVYSKETELTYAVKSLGITTLGVAGETMRGPAFQPMHIENWRQFTDTFGGTSTEKYKGSQYPKYELPYIAKSYLTESKQLEVVRVLGLSGYKAGPAWVVTARMNSFAHIPQNTDGSDGIKNRMVVAVLRSRAHYEKYHKFDIATDSCECPIDGYDRLVYEVGEIKRENGTCEVVGYNDIVKLKPYNPLYAAGNDCDGYEINSGALNNDPDNRLVSKVSATNYGRFTIYGLRGYQPYNKRWLRPVKEGGRQEDWYEYKDDSIGEISREDAAYFEYPVSLNPYDKDFILKVIGTDPQDGDAPVYCESLYEVALSQCISNTGETKVDGINEDLVFYNVYDPTDFDGLNPITGMLTLQESGLGRKYIGQRYVADEHTITTGETKNDPFINCHPYNYETNLPFRVKEFFDVNVDYTSGENTATITVAKKTCEDGTVYHEDMMNNMFTYFDASGNTKPIELTFEELQGNYFLSDTSESAFTIVKALTGKSQAEVDQNIADFKQQIEESLLMAKIEKYFVGQIYTVTQYTDEQGKRHYYYRYYPENSVKDWAYAQGYATGKTEIHVDEQTNKTYYTWAIDLVPLVDKLISNTGDTTINFKDAYCVSDARTGKIESTRLVMVKNLSDGLYYRLTDEQYIYNKTNGEFEISTDAENSFPKVMFVDCDLNNYASAYRYASTPWIVSNLKGDYEHIEINKLFRFHTISDGNNSNYEVKISIENIRPDEGTFDVVVRDINDTDEYVMQLERFSKCTLTPGDRNFIGYKIGTFDGAYESKSKYITVEVAEGSAVEQSVPAGFLGYPMAQYDGLQAVGGSGKYIKVINTGELDGEGNPIYTTKQSENFGVLNPVLKYNLEYDNEVKNRKQYFGLSTRVGVDIDAFTYKGISAYVNDPSMLTQGFHLDSRIDPSNYSGGHKPRITVDGELGYVFDSVSVQNRTATLTDIPAIGTESLMMGSIYEYVNLRKFTVYFYGGFDGWDVYRKQRSNTDDFKMSRYLGTFDTNSGEGYAFNRIDNPDAIGLNQGGITSDWYAYLAAYRQFANPEAVDINVFATPGIDYVNNNTLVNEVIDMIEEERADSIYVVTTPDKPSGAADFVDEMYTPDDAVFNLEDSEIDSNYTCTYYPWVKYLDQDNNQYIYLPVTKDVVRNFAQTDNQAFPWFAPAGLDRGDVNCVRAHFITKLADEDVLYEGRINPIKTFATDGVKVWGQKNLQIHESQLNRIAVRRLLLRMRKLIAIACRSLIFEPNDPVTKNMFLTAVTPIMDNIRANRGISDYRIEVNDSIESRDRRELPAKIYFKPYNALEYVTLDFILTPEGVSFDNI